jgi:SAM-dependent methyltransferase
VSAEAEHEVGFEEIYASAGSDLKAVPGPPWHRIRRWSLGSTGCLRFAVRPLVVGCGLGDDAEALSRRGYQVNAFDIAPTAIATCRRRSPNSGVDYQVADLFGLPDAWRARFDLVVEVRTLQPLPTQECANVAAAIAGTARRGALVWVHCLARDDAEPVTTRPWPVSRSELNAFEDAGLRHLEFREEPATGGRVYQHPSRLLCSAGRPPLRVYGKADAGDTALASAGPSRPSAPEWTHARWRINRSPHRE